MLRIALRLLFCCHLTQMQKSQVLRLRGVHQNKYLLELHNTRISLGMFTAVALFFPPFISLSFFLVQTCKATRRMAFFFWPVPDRCGLVWFQHHSRLQGGWKWWQCPERGREWRLSLGSDKEGNSEERLLASVSGLSYGEGGKEWLCPPSSSAPVRLKRCSNRAKQNKVCLLIF